MNLNEEEVERTKSLVKAGSEITGPAMGATIGSLLGGPIGAAIGGASAQLLQRGIIEIGTDIAERFLSKREKIRIGGVTIYAVDKILKKLDAGEMPRNDGFFEQPSTDHPACAEIPLVERSPDKEVIERILLAAQREHEEKKLPFLGNLLANIFFDSTIDKAQINLMIKLCKSISYRQLCILSIFAHTDNFKLREKDYDGMQEKLDFKEISLLQEINNLRDQELLICGDDPHIELTDLNPSIMKLQGVGHLIYKLMELRSIDESDIKPIILLLGPNNEV